MMPDVLFAQIMYILQTRHPKYYFFPTRARAVVTLVNRLLGNQGKKKNPPFTKAYGHRSAALANHFAGLVDRASETFLIRNS